MWLLCMIVVISMRFDRTCIPADKSPSSSHSPALLRTAQNAPIWSLAVHFSLQWWIMFFVPLLSARGSLSFSASYLVILARFRPIANPSGEISCVRWLTAISLMTSSVSGRVTQGGCIDWTTNKRKFDLVNSYFVLLFTYIPHFYEMNIVPAQLIMPKGKYIPMKKQTFKKTMACKTMNKNYVNCVFKAGHHVYKICSDNKITPFKKHNTTLTDYMNLFMGLYSWY